MSISGVADIAYELNDRTKIGCSYPGPDGYALCSLRLHPKVSVATPSHT
ncbi:hypothetical protein NXY10_13135 [Bacteroides fragilis]|nr:hypothetical protein NXY10_13135 [Bacteroides fragilis]